MNRRLIGIVLALVLGIVGTVVLVRYVQSARDDAAEPDPTTSILVVSNTLRQGASLEEVEANVTVTDVPDDLVADGALEDLDGLDPALIVAFELLPGEQLLGSRLVQPDELVSIDVPTGLQELTIALDPERVIGGRIEPGSTVGVVMSFDPFELATSGEAPTADPASPEAALPTQTPNTTKLTLNSILVTSLQLSRNDAERTTATQTNDEDNGDQPVIAADVSEAPGDQLLVTLAISAPEVEQIVFAAEFGRIWLTAQNAATDDSGSRILTLDQVYVGIPR
jgi:pilus assembly protein CpaB